MDRKSQIFTPTKKIAGIRRTYSKTIIKPKVDIRETINSFKNDIAPTVLHNCTYKLGDDIILYEKSKIQSILSHGKKHVCFLVSGESKTLNQNAVLKNMPKETQEVLKTLKNNK